MITLKTLPQATAQEVYNQVRDHLLKQGAVSSKDGTCVYRGEGNLKCAAGCLIGDDEYRPGMERTGWNNLVISGQVPREHGDLIYDLQGVHDRFDPCEWPENRKKLADNFHLIP